MASVANVSVGYGLVLDNEILVVSSVNASLKQLIVAPRGSYGSIAVPHKLGTMVLAAPANAFISHA